MEMAPSLALFITSFISLILSFRFVAAHSAQQQDIVRRGKAANGRVIEIGRPLPGGSFARIYFEYEPVLGVAPVRCCHVDRRLPGQVYASLPAVGTQVGVRYLPEKPTRAVIARLVSRFD
jgi:hypothetical protein